MYLGQTVKNPGVNYFGSGSYWVNHCKKHGGLNKKNIEVLWSRFFDKPELANIMLKNFELDHPDYYLQENLYWANQVPENTENNPFTGAGEYQKQRIREGAHPFNNPKTYENRWTDEHKAIQSAVTRQQNLDFWHTAPKDIIDARCKKMSESNTGKKSKFKDIARTAEDKVAISKGTKSAMADPALRSHLSQKAKARCDDTFKKRVSENNKRRVSCIKCGFETFLSTLASHQHGSKCK
jgi:hypothetical protein|tara:strand:+ start:3493 stop:4206 length:714 start_codon:yes stop_codon:yes gene_type:complete